MPDDQTPTTATSQEWERPKPPVTSLCKRCDNHWTIRRANPARVDGVVSPSGVEHIGLTGGSTACGCDATGDGWWWPL